MKKLAGILIIFAMFVVLPSVGFFFMGAPWYGWIACFAGTLGMILAVYVAYKVTVFAIGLILGDE